MTAPVELVRELLYYRDMRMIDHRDWGLITAFLALLELTRLKAIFLRQERPLGEISLRANPNYELSQSFRPA